MDSVGTRQKAEQLCKPSTRDGDLESMLDVYIKAFQGVLESATTCLNKRLNDVTLRHADDLAEIKISHTQ